MLDGISGEVRGTFRVDPRSGLIQRVTASVFLFRHDDTDAPANLSESQRSQAIEIVERTLRDADVNDIGLMFVGSGKDHSPSVSVSASTGALAEYLSTPRQHVVPGQRKRRAE